MSNKATGSKNKNAYLYIFIQTQESVEGVHTEQQALRLRAWRTWATRQWACLLPSVMNCSCFSHVQFLKITRFFKCDRLKKNHFITLAKNYSGLRERPCPTAPTANVSLSASQTALPKDTMHQGGALHTVLHGRKSKAAQSTRPHRTGRRDAPCPHTQSVSGTTQD